MRKVFVLVISLAFVTPAFAQSPQMHPQMQQQNDPGQESVALAYRQLGLSLNELLRSEQEKSNSLQQKINDLNKYWSEYTTPPPATK